MIEIDPGMVRTDEFALNRFDGDAQKAAAVYAGVAEPLIADDIADCVAWCATRPHHVNIDRLVVRPLAQAAQHKVHRVSPTPRRDRPRGMITRGTTNPNRLRRVDNWIAVHAAPICSGDAADPLVVDLGYGATPVTAVELRDRLRPRSGRTSAWSGWRSTRPGSPPPQPAADPPGLTFARGGFELAGLRPVVVRAFNVLRQYDEAEVDRGLGGDDGRARTRRRAGRGHLRRAGPARRPGCCSTAPGRGR